MRLWNWWVGLFEGRGWLRLRAVCGAWRADDEHLSLMLWAGFLDHRVKQAERVGKLAVFEELLDGIELDEWTVEQIGDRLRAHAASLSRAFDHTERHGAGIGVASVPRPMFRDPVGDPVTDRIPRLFEASAAVMAHQAGRCDREADTEVSPVVDRTLGGQLWTQRPREDDIETARWYAPNSALLDVEATTPFDELVEHGTKHGRHRAVPVGPPTIVGIDPTSPDTMIAMIPLDGGGQRVTVRTVGDIQDDRHRADRTRALGEYVRDAALQWQRHTYPEWEDLVDAPDYPDRIAAAYTETQHSADGEPVVETETEIDTAEFSTIVQCPHCGHDTDPFEELCEKCGKSYSLKDVTH